MKKKNSQKIIRQSRNMVSSSKDLPRCGTACDSLKAPKRKHTRKNRKFGDDITNLQKQPVFQSMDLEFIKPLLNQTQQKISQIQPYLNQIQDHIEMIDEKFNQCVLYKLATKNEEATEITLDMRRILIKWIIQVAEKFRASNETVHMSVQIIDYILVFSHQKITKFNFQLLGISALFVASKYNEIYTPEAKKYVYVCDGLYTLKDLFQMQSYILTLTNFNLQLPNVYDFLGPILKDSNLSEQLKQTVQNITKIIVMDFNLLNKYKKLHLSGVILYFSAKIHNLQRFNSKQMMQRMSIDQQTFKDCFSNIVNLYKQYFKQTNTVIKRNS